MVDQGSEVAYALKASQGIGCHPKSVTCMWLSHTGCHNDAHLQCHRILPIISWRHQPGHPYHWPTTSDAIIIVVWSKYFKLIYFLHKVAVNDEFAVSWVVPRASECDYIGLYILHTWHVPGMIASTCDVSPCRSLPLLWQVLPVTGV